MKKVRYCLEFDLPKDPAEHGDFVNHLLGKRWRVMHMDIHTVTVCKEYDDYRGKPSGGDHVESPSQSVD